jgi:predicted O-methyltransferase YrrM
MVRAATVAKRIAGRDAVKGAEIGVFTGAMSAALLNSCPNLELFMVDSWEANGAAYKGDSGDYHADLDRRKQDWCRTKAIEGTSFAKDRRSVLAMRSLRAAELVHDDSLDFAFIDADHSYEGCKADIEAWTPKIKRGGWICGHDYANPDFPKFGVTKAVDEFVAARGLKLETDENFTWFARIPAH